jgi:MAPEG family
MPKRIKPQDADHERMVSGKFRTTPIKSTIKHITGLPRSARLVSPILLHILCIALLIGRVTHAVGVAQPNENFRLRVTAMILTLNTLAAASIILLATYIF